MSEPRSSAQRDGSAEATIRATRLKFVRNVIEPLGDDDSFQVVTPEGVFRMTKAQFYRIFDNVVASDSYRIAGWYGYSTTPQKAAVFRVEGASSPQKAPRTKYELPPFLHGRVPPEWYKRWLGRKATAHVKRDRKRGNKAATTAAYKEAIHDAVLASAGSDSYTGEELRWDLLSKYDNKASKASGRKYKREFYMLPTVDHVGDGLGAPDFAICSWQSNDAKNDMTYDELVAFCRKVLGRHHTLASS